MKSTPLGQIQIEDASGGAEAKKYHYLSRSDKKKIELIIPYPEPRIILKAGLPNSALRAYFWQLDATLDLFLTPTKIDLQPGCKRVPQYHTKLFLAGFTRLNTFGLVLIY